MTGWRQAVFIRQRRIDVIQRALSTILDDESWSPATPRRLRVGVTDASSRGWTMIVPELANFFLERGGTSAPRLCRLARELRCPAYEVDVRNTAAVTLFEVSPIAETGELTPEAALRISGSPSFALCLRAETNQLGEPLTVASTTVSFGLLPLPDDIRERITNLQRSQPAQLADYLGALAGFPGWTQLPDGATAGELVYEPPRITALATAALTTRSETRGAIARTTPRAALPSHDRRGTRPRSAARPRR